MGRSDDLSVEIYNEGGYGQEYSYSLSDSLGLEFFNKTGTIFIPNNEKYKMSFPMPDYIHTVSYTHLTLPTKRIV